MNQIKYDQVDQQQERDQKLGDVKTKLSLEEKRQRWNERLAIKRRFLKESA